MIDLAEQGPSAVPASRREKIALALVLVFYALFLVVYTVPAYSDHDAHGYQAGASRWVETGHRYVVPRDEFLFVGDMWVGNAEGHYYPKYPPGYPTLIGLARGLFGFEGGCAVAPLCGLLGVLGVYLLGRQLGLGRLALVAAACWATNPVWGLFSVSQLSHTPDIAALIFAVSAVLAGRRRSGTAGALLCVAGGFLFGVAGTVRYSSFALGLPFLILAVQDWRAGRRTTLPALAAGFLPVFSWLCVYHARAFGSPFRTGYSLTGEQTSFSLLNFPQNAFIYLINTATVGLMPLFVLSLIGLAWVLTERRRTGVLLISAAVPFALMYGCFYWVQPMSEFLVLRFMLPMLVMGVFLAMVALRVVEPALTSRSWRLALALVVSAQVVLGGSHMVQKADSLHRQHVYISELAGWLREKVPVGSSLFAPQLVLHLLDAFPGRYLYSTGLLARSFKEGEVETLPFLVQEKRKAVVDAELTCLDDDAYKARVRQLFRDLGQEGAVYLAVDPVTLTYFGIENCAEKVGTWTWDPKRARIPFMPTFAGWRIGTPAAHPSEKILLYRIAL